jgi:ATP-dependent Clp protease adapter protein ClpS
MRRDRFPVQNQVLPRVAEESLRVANKIQTIEIARERQQPMPLYHTVVHNCGCHTFDDVIFGLMRIVGMGLRDAELKAKEVDFFGSGVVATANFEIAEMYATRLRTEVISASGTTLQTSVRPAAGAA